MVEEYQNKIERGTSVTLNIKNEFVEYLKIE